MSEVAIDSQSFINHSPTITGFKQEMTGTRPDDNRYCDLSADPSSFNGYGSITEKEINSHNLIREILQKSKKKTVQHTVNQIPITSQLYAIPKNRQCMKQQFSTIPPRNPEFSSTCSKKIQQINERLSVNKDLSERLVELAERNREKCSLARNARPVSADTNINKRVSVSGLVSYSFNSVRARRSLGNFPERPEEQILSDNIDRMKKRNSCSCDRERRIIRKKPNQGSLHRAQIEKAAVCDFHTPTEKFLKVLRKESKKDEKIYGERMEKLKCVKQYMEKQQTNYEQADFIVNAVMEAQRREPKPKVKKPKYVLDDDKELANRKVVWQSKRVMIKHLCFADA